MLVGSILVSGITHSKTLESKFNRYYDNCMGGPNEFPYCPQVYVSAKKIDLDIGHEVNRPDFESRLSKIKLLVDRLEQYDFEIIDISDNADKKQITILADNQYEEKRLEISVTHTRNHGDGSRTSVSGRYTYKGVPSDIDYLLLNELKQDISFIYLGIPSYDDKGLEISVTHTQNHNDGSRTTIRGNYSYDKSLYPSTPELHSPWNPNKRPQQYKDLEQERDETRIEVRFSMEF